MLTNQIKIALLFLGSIFLFASCEKATDCKLNDPCQEACELVPMMGWCGTGAEFKYYFDQTTQECKAYIHTGDVVPFETLEECEACLCNRLVGADNK